MLLCDRLETAPAQPFSKLLSDRHQNHQQQRGRPQLLTCLCFHYSAVSYGDLLAGVRGRRSQEYASFIGCFKDMKYSTDGAILQDIPVGMKEGVTPGCIDRCQGGDRCKNNGRCVNLYKDFHCDCFGTDYEGRTCEKQGKAIPRVFTLQS